MKTTPPTITTEDAEKLLVRLRWHPISTKKGLKGIRNHCIALLMLDAGLRVGEVVQLLVTDLVYNYTVVNSLRVRAAIAKNKRERTIPLSHRLRDSIEQLHIKCWQQDGRSFSDYAFYQLTNDSHLTTRQVERIIRAAAMKSLGRPVHPHVLRHTFASRLMRTSNARIVQQLLGHEHLSTTQIYTHPNQDDLKIAIATLGHELTHPQYDSQNLATLSDTPDRPDTTDTDRHMR